MCDVTPASVRDRLLRARAHIADCVRNGYAGTEFQDLSIAKFPAYASFIALPDRAHSDYLLHVSQEVKARRMGSHHMVACAVNPSGRKIYVTAQALEGLEPVTEHGYRTAGVVSHAKWLKLDGDQRARLREDGAVLVTSALGDVVSRSAGRRMAWLAGDAPVTAELDQRATTPTPEGFLALVGLRAHGDHYCAVGRNTLDTQHALDALGRRAGAVMVRPHSVCDSVVTKAEMEAMLASLFPGQRDPSTAAVATDTAYNMTAVMPAIEDAAHGFMPAATMEICALVPEWDDRGESQAKYDAVTGAWSVRQRLG